MTSLRPDGLSERKVSSLAAAEIIAASLRAAPRGATENAAACLTNSSKGSLARSERPGYPRGMIPTLRLLYCCLTWALLGVAASVWLSLQAAWQWAGLAWGVVSFGDLLWLLMQRRVQVERRLDSR